ncbi:zinc finger BED domain-containing protein 5-like [Aphis craccivora]|uniref:Zinc finger BED domain-containing protein 5-like n=1 Tax=Aphis craccivora TaxID=307492 RepID=A0A6G0ZGB6_APHCR|nr:zinc finger BED domain-containing protein 5-like [Aphis craccivora]
MVNIKEELGNQELYQMFCNKPIVSSYLKSHIWRSEGIAKNLFTGRLNEELIRIEDSEDRDIGGKMWLRQRWS